MLKQTPLNLVKNYRVTLQDLEKMLVNELGGEIQSLVLYGSIARGNYGPESDIDILVIIKNKESEDRAMDISYGIDCANQTVTSLITYTEDEIRNKILIISPFIQTIIEEGRVLYDDGTWAKLSSSFGQKS